MTDTQEHKGFLAGYQEFGNELYRHLTRLLASLEYYYKREGMLTSADIKMHIVWDPDAQAWKFCLYSRWCGSPKFVHLFGIVTVNRRKSVCMLRLFTCMGMEVCKCSMYIPSDMPSLPFWTINHKVERALEEYGNESMDRGGDVCHAFASKKGW